MSGLTDEALYGLDLFGDPIRPKPSGPLADQFGFPPFSVLDARQGSWQDRKAAWISLGLEGEVGRDSNLIGYSSAASLGEKDTSVFDPVLTEICYRWFCPPSGLVLDPFAGGSVRGIVAHLSGFGYYGIELRREQVDANYRQAQAIGVCPAPNWKCGNSIDLLPASPLADFVFSCPPYGDLEKYSDDPDDLSNMEWHAFRAAYRRIVLRSVSRLKENRFACFVVGDFRDKSGYYRNFVSDTISAFEECGARLYNEAVLVTAVGSASMRAARIFNGGRKLCKTHQNVLVFCKGDWRHAARAVGSSE